MLIHRVPVVECMYGWGRKATLYHDCLEANGTIYLLSDLIYVEPVYLRLMGISSIRLNLFFKQQMVVLRGLTDNEYAQKMIQYLTSFICSLTESTMGFPEISCYEADRSTSQHALTISSHSSFWDYNREEISPCEQNSSTRQVRFDEAYQNLLPVKLSPSVYLPEENAEDAGMTEEYEITKSIKRVVLADLSSDGSIDPTYTDLLALYGQLILPEIVYLPEHIESRSVHYHAYSDNLQQSGAYEKVSSSASPLRQATGLAKSSQSQVEKKAVQTQLAHERHRLKRLQAQYEIRVFGFSVEGLLAQLRQGQLPCIDVPLKLLPGEIAHYRTDATLCEEPIEAMSDEEAKQYYPIKCRIKDRGSFILTNTRILYLGRKRHMLLGYEQLLHIARWHNFMALTVANFQKRQLFEMRRPLECTLYLEYLLRRYLASGKIETGAIPPVSRSPLSLPETASSIRTRALARMGRQVL